MTAGRETMYTCPHPPSDVCSQVQMLRERCDSDHEILMRIAQIVEIHEKAGGIGQTPERLKQLEEFRDKCSVFLEEFAKVRNIVDAIKDSAVRRSAGWLQAALVVIGAFLASFLGAVAQHVIK